MPGPGAGPTAPLTLGEVDAAVVGGLLHVPHLELARAGDPVNSAQYTPAPWRGSPPPPTRALSRRLEGELGRRVEAFFFVTPPGAQGLTLHRGDADVLLLQSTGSKHWTVRGGPAGPDWAPGEVANDGPALLTDTLHPGHVLCIPRGFAHEAVSGDEASAHLSLTIREMGTQQLFASLQRLLLDGLPVPPRPLDDAALDAAAEALPDRFRSRLPELTAQAVVEHARRAQLAEGAIPGLGPDPRIAALAARHVGDG